MTKDDIIRMAVEAGFPKRFPEFYTGCFEKIIIEAYNQGRTDEIKRVYGAYVDPVLAEREACVKVCEERAASAPTGSNEQCEAEDCAAAIRARGQA